MDIFPDQIVCYHVLQNFEVIRGFSANEFKKALALTRKLKKQDNPGVVNLCVEHYGDQTSEINVK